MKLVLQLRMFALRIKQHEMMTPCHGKHVMIYTNELVHEKSIK